MGRRWPATGTSAHARGHSCGEAEGHQSFRRGQPVCRPLRGCQKPSPPSRGADALVRPLVTGRHGRSGSVQGSGTRGKRSRSMRFCTLTQDAPAPRESAGKWAPRPAAPVGGPSQTRGHHLTPTLVFKQTCTQHFFFFTGCGAFSFSCLKRKCGAHLPSHHHG